jgi:hypothetical protein
MTIEITPLIYETTQSGLYHEIENAISRKQMSTVREISAKITSIWVEQYRNIRKYM